MVTVKDELGYYAATRANIVNLFPRNHYSKVLELGCGCANTLHYLKKNKIAEYVVGIEKISDCADRINKLDPPIDEYYIYDVESGLEKKIKGKNFNLILLLDVLEHLNEPYEVLKELWNFLEEKGQIIISIPNIRYLPILYKLIFRKSWEYTEWGILDKTHLRFFTWESFHKKFCEEFNKSYGEQCYLINRIDKKVDDQDFFRKMLILLPFFREMLIMQNFILIEKIEK